MVEEQRHLPSVQVWPPSIPDILRASDECCAGTNLSRNRARILQDPHPPAHPITTVALEAGVEEAASCRTCSATSSLARRRTTSPRVTRPRMNMVRAAVQTTTPGVPEARIDLQQRAHLALLSLQRRHAKTAITTYPEDGATRWTDRVCVRGLAEDIWCCVDLVHYLPTTQFAYV